MAKSRKPSKPKSSKIGTGKLNGALPLKKQKYCEQFAKHGSHVRASQEIGLSRQATWRWHQEGDKEFDAAFADAKRAYVDRLEAEIDRRAVEGVTRLKFDRNGQALIDPRTGEVYEERTYSDTLLIFRAKAEAPEKYGEKVDVNHAGKLDMGGVENWLAGARRIAETLKDE